MAIKTYRFLATTCACPAATKICCQINSKQQAKTKKKNTRTKQTNKQLLSEFFDVKS